MRGNVRTDAVQPAGKPDQSEPAWYQSYFSALLESNQNRARVKIELARKTLQNRILELTFNSIPSNSGEVQDLQNALTYLRLLLEHIGKEKTSRWR
jgi:hypothetical protein